MTSSEEMRLLERKLRLLREEGERKDRAIETLARANAEILTALARALESGACRDGRPLDKAAVSNGVVKRSAHTSIDVTKQEGTAFGADEDLRGEGLRMRILRGRGKPPPEEGRDERLRDNVKIYLDLQKHFTTLASGGTAVFLALAGQIRGAFAQSLFGAGSLALTLLLGVGGMVVSVVFLDQPRPYRRLDTLLYWVVLLLLLLTGAFFAASLWVFLDSALEPYGTSVLRLLTPS